MAQKKITDNFLMKIIGNFLSKTTMRQTLRLQLFQHFLSPLRGDVEV